MALVVLPGDARLALGGQDVTYPLCDFGQDLCLSASPLLHLSSEGDVVDGPRAQTSFKTFWKPHLLWGLGPLGMSDWGVALGHSEEGLGPCRASPGLC